MTVILIASAVVRRLHDTGRRGGWALMPLPFLVTGFPLMATIVGADDMEPFGPGSIMLLFANNMIYLGTLLALIIMLAQRGQPGANAYGDPPA